MSTQPFSPRPPTAGDQAPAAAAGGAEGIETTDDLSIVSIPYSSPAASDPDGPITGSIGDQVFQAQSTLTGGTELTVIPTELPKDAYRVFKLSPLLSPIVDAFNVNVYSAGFTLKPVLPIEDPEARERVRETLQYLKAWAAGDFEADTSVGDKELDAEIDRIRTRMHNEAQFLDAWFSRACPGSSYLQLCAVTGQDLEIQGDGYWEVLRDTTGAPAKLVWAPAWSIRAKPLGMELIGVDVPVRLSDLTWGTERQMRRFRSYVQVDLNNVIIARYKEYGDPRVLSRRTGKFYVSLEAMRENHDEWVVGPDHQWYPPLPATELLHFELPNPLSTTYGKPGYTGVYPCLDGTRDLAEENRSVVTDQKVPQLFVLIAGGAGVPQEQIDRLQTQIEQNTQQGKRSIYFIQARSAKNEMGRVSPTPTVSIERTKSEQHSDMLGLKYHDHSEEQVEHAYRFPAAALGRHKGLSDGTIQAGYRFAEAQVYDPRRDIFDDRLNTTLLPDLGIQLTKYKTCSRIPKEPNELARIIRTLMDGGVLTPDEGRALASDIFNRDFRDLEGIWSKLPTKLLLAMLQTKNQLVAAALLGSESESDIIARLQAALLGQLEGAGVATPTGGADLGASQSDKGRLLGPGGSCVCPSCGATAPHETGQPCSEKACPQCGNKMGRPASAEKADLAAGDTAAGGKLTPGQGNLDAGMTCVCPHCKHHLKQATGTQCPICPECGSTMVVSHD